MSDTEQRIAVLKAAATSAQTARARAEAQREAIEERHRTTLQELQTRFGVPDVASATAKLAQFDAELATLLDTAERKLEGTQ